MPITRFHATGRMSPAVRYPLSGEAVVLAGQVSSDPALDLAGQTANVLARIDALLAEAGTSKANMIQATIWLADIGGFAAMNAVWDGWCDASCAPARACVEAKLADPRLLVEIQVVAVV